MSTVGKIFKSINEIQKKVSFVKKDKAIGKGVNTYTIATHDAVLGAIRSHLIDEGVLIIPKQLAKGLSVDGTTKYGDKNIRFEAMYEIQFISILDGSNITIVTEAHGLDNSDKATGKAITYAVKNAMLKMFLLETGDNEGQQQQNLINMTQVSIIQKLLVATNTDPKEFLAGYSSEKIADLQEGSFNHAMNALQTKQKKGA